MQTISKCLLSMGISFTTTSSNTVKISQAIANEIFTTNYPLHSKTITQMITEATVIHTMLSPREHLLTTRTAYNYSKTITENVWGFHTKAPDNAMVHIVQLEMSLNVNYTVLITSK